MKAEIAKICPTHLKGVFQFLFYQAAAPLQHILDTPVLSLLFIFNFFPLNMQCSPGLLHKTFNFSYFSQKNQITLMMPIALGYPFIPHL